MPKIKLRIRPNGKIEEYVLEVKGEKCVTLTQPLERALGEIVSRQYEMEFFEQATTGMTEVQTEQQTT
jgi:hypothetical protein